MQVDELLKPFPIKEFHPFPRAMLGPGAHEMIGPEAKKLGFRKILVMTTGLRGSDTVHKINESLKYHGLETVVYDKVESNPKDYNVMDAVAMYQENKCDSFVSIGGGSAHDACKGARVSVAHDGRSVNEFEGFNKSENPKNPPHIAVSTTAGTGSETSWAYVITDTTTDPDHPHKYVAFDDACVTSLAIDDPVLYYDCPLDYTCTAPKCRDWSDLDFGESLTRPVALVDHAEYLPALHRRPERHDSWLVVVGWPLIPGLVRPVPVIGQVGCPPHGEAQNG